MTLPPSRSDVTFGKSLSNQLKAWGYSSTATIVVPGKWYLGDDLYLIYLGDFRWIIKREGFEPRMMASFDTDVTDEEHPEADLDDYREIVAQVASEVSRILKRVRVEPVEALAYRPGRIGRY